MGALTTEGDRSIDCKDPAVRGNERLWGEAVGVKYYPRLLTSSARARELRGPEDYIGFLINPDDRRGGPWGILARTPEVPLTRRESFEHSHVGRYVAPIILRLGL